MATSQQKKIDYGIVNSQEWDNMASVVGKACRRDQYGCRRELLLKYKLSPEQFDELWKAQDGKCAICKEDIHVRPQVDHCHRTGKVRALLCRRCNTGLGAFRDNPRLLAQAIVYLEDHGSNWTQWED